MKGKFLICLVLLLGCLSFVLQALKGHDISSTDWNTQTAPKGMVLIQTDSLLPYYISVTEEPNIHWQTYLQWLKTTFVSYPEVYKTALPQDTVEGLWLQYNDPMILNYSGHPAFQWYPVTGVSWQQVKSFLEWKTDRLNEVILDKAEIIDIQMDKTIDDHNFNTEAYLNGQYSPNPGKKYKEFLKSKEFINKMYPYLDLEAADGIIFPQYRLPTEAEWEAALLELKDLKNAEYILASLNQTDFLYEWMVGYDLTEPYKCKETSNAINAIANFENGVSEWLLDLSTYRQGKKIPEIEVLMSNGWHDFMYYNPLDHYGEVMEKDSLGRVKFNFVQVSNVNKPIYLASPRLKEYKGENTMVPNLYFNKSEEYMDSILKSRYYQYFLLNSKLYNNDFKTCLISLRIDARQMVRDSLENTWVNRLLSDNTLLKRKYIASNFKNNTGSVASLEQGKASPFIGFRCVLPYTGVTAKRGYKVKW